jgi:hypothetical protein
MSVLTETNQDAVFAKELCDNNSEAIEEFQQIYSDELYYIAARFCNRGTKESSWDYRTKKGYTIQVSDLVSDTYLWLAKQAFIKSCLYKGKSSFAAYIKTVLNSTFTFKDWLKQKVDSSLVKKTGTVGYVPSAIKKLGGPCLDVFKQLRYGKSDSFICKKLGLDLESYYGYYDQVEETLIDSGQIDLLRNPIVGSIDTSDQDGEENPGFQLEGEVAANPSIIPDYKYLESLIQNVIGTLSKVDKKIINLWAIGYSVDEIFETFGDNKFLKESLKDIKISKASSLYAYIEKIITNCVKMVTKTYPKEQEQYLFNNKKIKKVLKVYYNNF